MIIKTKDIQQVLLLTNNYLKFYFPNDIEIKNDYYSAIKGNLFDVEKEPRVVIGSLMDDWECLNLLLLDKDRPFTSVDLDRLAAILNAVSEIINPVTS
ncbi:MAG: hypothetical protein JWO06_2729 [Bacteroidota bacterium]|nr:hypothetical protein [Bacteroidota bacterium]